MSINTIKFNMKEVEPFLNEDTRHAKLAEFLYTAYLFLVTSSIR